jgi:hypothetical protein
MVTNRVGISFGSHREISKICSDDWNRWRFWSAFRNFGTHFAENFRMSKCSWMMDPTRSCEMPSFSATYFAKIRLSSRISFWIFSIIYRKITVLGRPGRGALQVEQLARLNWDTHFLTMEYYGEFPLTFLSEWREFPSAPCLTRQKEIMTGRVTMLLKLRA